MAASRSAFVLQVVPSAFAVFSKQLTHVGVQITYILQGLLSEISAGFTVTVQNCLVRFFQHKSIPVEMHATIAAKYLLHSTCHVITLTPSINYESNVSPGLYNFEHVSIHQKQQQKQPKTTFLWISRHHTRSVGSPRVRVLETRMTPQNDRDIMRHLWCERDC